VKQTPAAKRFSRKSKVRIWQGLATHYSRPRRLGGFFVLLLALIVLCIIFWRIYS
jgi:hypothetical protein